MCVCVSKEAPKKIYFPSFGVSRVSLSKSILPYVLDETRAVVAPEKEGQREVSQNGPLVLGMERATKRKPTT